MNKNKKNFKLSIEDNYINEIKYTNDVIIKKYFVLLNHYIVFCIDNTNIKNRSIYNAGLDMMRHVYTLLFLYTKNLELSVYHTNNAIYYYLEYMSQITDTEDNIFFNLTIKDAVMYVYNRTIFDINKKFKKSNTKKDCIILKELDVFSLVNTFLKNVSTIYLNTLILDKEKIRNMLDLLLVICLKNREGVNYTLNKTNDNLSYEEIISLLKSVQPIESIESTESIV